MSFIKHKFDQIRYYGYLVNPLVPRMNRILRALARNAHKRYRLLEESQWWPREKLTEYQNRKLRDLIIHAYRNVPYYREAFEGNGVRPEDIRTSGDLTRLPILTKNIIRENFPERIVYGLQEVGDDGVWTTGGSTGEPLKFYGDMRANDFAWAGFYRFCRWHGYEWGDRVSIFFRPFALSDERPLYQRLLDKLKNSMVPNVKYYDGSRLRDSDLKWVVRDVINNRTRIVRGYPSSLVRLAQYCKENGIAIRPNFVTTTGETLFDWQREVLKKEFQTDVFDQYGCAEIIGVSFECECHNGLHISHEHCIVEVVDEGGKVLPAGRSGTLLLTDLDNYRMPFIRYQVGDEGSIKEEPCGCGRNLALMDNVIGRECDMVIGGNGRMAHGLFFVTLLQDARWFERFGVRDFEVVQRTKDRIDVSLVCQNMPDAETAKEFRALCSKYFGQTLIGLSFVDEIPRTSAGKRRYTRYEVGSKS